MRNLLLAFALLTLAGVARSQTQSFTAVSSCTYSGMTVSTGTYVRRIDNLNKGVVQLMPNRTSLKITLPEGSKDIYVAIDSSVSSNTASAFYGRQLFALAAESRTYELPVTDGLTVYAVGEDSAGAAGQRISTEQCRPQANTPF